MSEAKESATIHQI